MSASPADLSEQFKVPGLEFVEGHGGLTKAVVSTSTASGELYLHGAHVTAWHPNGHAPVLWMSGRSNFLAGKAIRGGVPICFPWFGPHPEDSTAPAHGFARIREWTLQVAEATNDGGVCLTLQAEIGMFRLEFRVRFGSRLSMSLTTTLSAAFPTVHHFEDALHTYFSVGDVRRISISGLQSAVYLDKVDGGVLKAAESCAIRFCGETDRVYVSSEPDCILLDEVLERRVIVQKSGSNSTVIWNPWIDKSIRMPDFGDDEWPGMVCIETANVGKGQIELQPGHSHTTNAVISVQSLNVQT